MTINNNQTITSLRIAEISGKNHFDVLKSIRNMEKAWEKINESKFTCISYKDEMNRSKPMFELTFARARF